MSQSLKWFAIVYFLVYNFEEKIVASWYLLACRVKIYLQIIMQKPFLHLRWMLSRRGCILLWSGRARNQDGCLPNHTWEARGWLQWKSSSSPVHLPMSTVTPTPDCYEGRVIPHNGACCESITILKIKLLTACNNSWWFCFNVLKVFQCVSWYHNVYLLFTISPVFLPTRCSCLPPTITIVSVSILTAECWYLSSLKW